MNKIFFINSLKSLKGDIFFLVLSTTADIRYDLLHFFLKKFKVKYCLLEKILFQKLIEYNKAFKLIKNSKTKVWVNTPLRNFPIFKKFLSDNKSSKYFELDVTGNNWGILAILFIILILFHHFKVALI